MAPRLTRRSKRRSSERAPMSVGMRLTVGLGMVSAILFGTEGFSRAATTATKPAIRPLPIRSAFDYQLADDYPPGPYTSIVVRDWFSGKALPSPGYSICSINAFQTQAEDPDANRPDERSNWPTTVVSNIEDPGWPGEFLIDLSSEKMRHAAFAHVKNMIDRCAQKGFAAIEFDNLDSYTRRPSLPFGQREALQFATMLTKHAHKWGLAVAQKNTPDLTKQQSLKQVGFDFAIVERCAEYAECDRYTQTYGDAVLAVEYNVAGFAKACRISNRTFAVLLRDRELLASDQPGHRLKRCEKERRRT